MLRSLRARLMIGALLWILAGVTIAGISISALFRAHVIELVDAELTGHLDELSSLLSVDHAGHLSLYRRLSDPRFQNRGAGFYWQITEPPRIALRSPTLVGRQVLPVPIVKGAGTVRRTMRVGSATMIGFERIWRSGTHGPIYLQVAADTRFVEGVLAHFNRTLAISLGTLSAALLVAAAMQIGFGLAPMRRMRAAMANIRSGQASRLLGRFPSEVQPLVDDLNALLDANAAMLLRSRTQAGNLAHALKTPLAVLADEAECLAARGETDGAATVREQAARMGRQIDYQLTRARAAASAGTPGIVASVAPVAAPIVTAMRRLYASREITLECDIDPDLACAVDPLDLSEMLANLVDNACKWASAGVAVEARRGLDGMIRIAISDDGPGIAPEYREVVFGAGNRLDETVSGSGLGLSIARELAELYGGRIALESRFPSGLRASLALPAI